MGDVRRSIPRTDAVLEQLADHVARFGRDRVKAAVVAAQQQARDGAIAASDVARVAAELLVELTSFTPVINATGVVVHTNLGRAPLSRNAFEALGSVAGYVDIEFDLETGLRSKKRGSRVLDALIGATPGAEAALVVNNGAAAMSLVMTCLAAGQEVIVSRGELIEIGDGFRLPDLIESTGPRLREVGMTNRTHLRDYADAVGPDTGCILKVHPSNYRVEGFVAEVPVSELRELGAPVVVDIGSGLLQPDSMLPDEPSASAALDAGADLVTASGDKLLGGPQAGIILGRAELVERVRRHPLARAMRVDKLTLAALEATLTGPDAPVTVYRRLTADELLPRTKAMADSLGSGSVDIVEVEGRIGGGGAPGVSLPGWALALPESVAAQLRSGRPAVVARIADGRCLVDLRCVPPETDAELTRLIREALDADR
ncbi:L-seryl-tRNA(Sec) selenium transferase [Yimella sp. cx-51]|uniref:L-seryl-tRNA(Sec) selenium transferase n=1 Tax=Yimella sp. cx-51 TaxID=2770551 RepID=UPI00165DF071|nr:L-seryl-tRNA(Sec) selenium transferase [Yimella sp. cx-51]MBC9958394.1 L-seryl-tRNA(Sec) selenium transferase [Yimella sp. cx-51]QTH38201.1 L-seryl-tRNA(Sec) selenium transferase [Yimella sp. cx-51]